MPSPLFEANFADFSALLTKLDTIARASFVRELRKVIIEIMAEELAS